MPGALSTLDAAGRDAEQIAQLFWFMSIGAAIIWAAVVAAAFYCARGPRRSDAQQLSGFVIIGGGVVIPTAVLGALLMAGLPPITQLVDKPRPGHILIDAAGEQWWWRFRYLMPSGQEVEVANELRLPAGGRVDVRLTSDNVIHSFWIPSISGKVDMIPGRATHLSLEPTRAGVFRGVCAEYCGTSHALMAFTVVVLEKGEFARWIDMQSAAAREPGSPLARSGRELFVANGCGACHAVRGAGAAEGRIGPDLTHVASRLSVAAGSASNDANWLVNWITNPQGIKPDAHMPAFGMLAADEIRAMAAYLSSLQ